MLFDQIAQHEMLLEALFTKIKCLENVAVIVQ